MFLSSNKRMTLLISICITIILMLSIYLRFSTLVIVRCNQSTEMCPTELTAVLQVRHCDVLNLEWFVREQL